MTPSEHRRWRGLLWLITLATGFLSGFSVARAIAVVGPMGPPCPPCPEAAPPAPCPFVPDAGEPFRDSSTLTADLDHEYGPEWWWGAWGAAGSAVGRPRQSHRHVYTRRPGESQADAEYHQANIDWIESLPPKAPWVDAGHTFEEYFAWRKAHTHALPLGSP